MLALGVAFESACEDLGIGISSLDVSKRERIARLILGFIAKGEGNPEVLRRRVVLHFRKYASAHRLNAFATTPQLMADPRCSPSAK